MSLHDVSQKVFLMSLQHLSYPRGFSGDPELLDALAGFFNSYFEPCVRVESSHLATAPGAASCLDALFYNICDPGDGILVPGPFWSKTLPELSGTLQTKLAITKNDAV